jgi:hypothetical protein
MSLLRPRREAGRQRSRVAPCASQGANRQMVLLRVRRMWPLVTSPASRPARACRAAWKDDRVVIRSYSGATVNYRRGFRRVYVVCAVFWMLAVLVVSVRDKPDGDRRTTGIPVQTKTDEFGGVALTDAEVAKLDQASAGHSSEPLRVGKSEPLPSPPGSYWISRSALALLPAALGYVLAFWLTPWIYRGFRADEQT